MFVDRGRPPIPHLNDSISRAPAEVGSTLWFIGYLVVLVLNKIPRGCFNCAKHMSGGHEKFPQESGPTVNLSWRFMPLRFMPSRQAFYRERPRDGSKVEGVVFFSSQICFYTLASIRGNGWTIQKKAERSPTRGFAWGKKKPTGIGREVRKKIYSDWLDSFLLRS